MKLKHVKMFKENTGVFLTNAQSLVIHVCQLPPLMYVYTDTVLLNFLIIIEVRRILANHLIINSIQI